MSRELSYFPPRGTKWQWEPKGLNYHPWMCSLLPKVEPKLHSYLWPLSVILRVDLIKGRYIWVVEVREFSGKDLYVKGWKKDPLIACRAAEKEGEARLKRLLPKWVRTAIRHKWRPPSSVSYEPAKLVREKPIT